MVICGILSVTTFLVRSLVKQVPVKPGGATILYTIFTLHPEAETEVLMRGGLV